MDKYSYLDTNLDEYTYSHANPNACCEQYTDFDSHQPFDPNAHLYPFTDLCSRSSSLLLRYTRRLAPFRGYLYRLWLTGK